MVAALTAQQAKKVYMGAEIVKEFPPQGVFRGKVYKIDINMPDGDGVVWPLLFKVKCDREWKPSSTRRGVQSAAPSCRRLLPCLANCWALLCALGAGLCTTCSFPLSHLC